MEIGRRSRVLLGGAWDFLFFGMEKEREEFTQRTQRCHRVHREKKTFCGVGAQEPTLKFI